MFLIDYILFGFGIFLVLLGFACFVFYNKFFDFLADMDLPPLFIMCGIAFFLFPLFSNLIFNRCDVCEKIVTSDYCTKCGSFVASDSVCSCGENLFDGYDFCPSCGIELEFSSD